MSDIAIHIKDVNKRFGDTHAVRDLELTVPTGSLCGFLGPNGAGKSTTIRMIMSIIYADSGTIEVLGGRALDRKDRIGYLPEERGLYRKMRVGEFLAYIATLKGVGKRGLAARIRDWLERVDLPEVENKRCQELSKGMQQKVQFLAAIIHDPDLLILDEPFSGLDPVNAELLRQLIDDLHTAGKTVIFSTHVLPQAEELCDRIFLIHRGVKLLDSTLDEIRTRFDPRTIEVEPLNGMPALNGVPGVVDVESRAGGRLADLHLADDCDPTEVIRAVVRDHPVRSIRLRRVTLEEAFVQLVQAGEGATEALRVREELSHG